MVLEMNVRWEGKHLNSVFLRAKTLKAQHSLYIEFSTSDGLVGPLLGDEASILP